VDLIKHHVADPIEPGGIVVEDVAKDLGGHDHQGSAVVDGVLSGDQTHVGGTVAVGEVVELLIGERLQRRRVDDPRVGPAHAIRGEQASPHRVFRHQRLAAAGGGGHQHPCGPLQLLDRLPLECIQGEGQRGFEGGHRRLDLAVVASPAFSRHPTP